MKVRSRAKISQCMIVKNEEANIERALSWGKGVVSEQIVVDTGSTDRTVEIAERMGAKIYHFEWIDDFSAAKNFAISKAKYEWIAFLDADEYYLEEDAKKLLFYVRQLQNKSYDAILSSWVHLDNERNVMAVGTQARVFRNRPGLRYVGRIHETILSIDGTEFHFVDAVNELAIYHLGYGKIQHEEKTSSGRNRKIILKELEKRPDNYQMLGYLGDDYMAANQLDEAQEAFEKAIALMPDTVEYIDPIRTAMTFTKLMEILYARRNTPEDVFMGFYEKAIRRLPEEADFDYYAGKYYASLKKFPEAEKYLKRALDQLEKYGTAFKSMFLSGDIKEAYEMLAACCFNNHNLAECINYSVILLKADRYLANTIFLLLASFLLDEASGREGAAPAEAVAQFLGENLYDFTTLKDRLFVLKAAMRLQYHSLIAVIRGMFTPEELAAVDQALAAENAGSAGNAGSAENIENAGNAEHSENS